MCDPSSPAGTTQPVAARLAVLRELREAEAAATEAPWSVVGEYHAGHMIGAVIRPEKRRDVAYVGADEDVAYCASTIHDARLIAAARNALPFLLAAADSVASANQRAERLAERIVEARKALRRGQTAAALMALDGALPPVPQPDTDQSEETP